MSTYLDSENSAQRLRLTGLLSLIQGLLILVPTIILGQAIGWPATLDDPASEALPRLLEQEVAVRIGYAAYLLMSILFVVTVAMVAKLSSGKTMNSLIRLIVGFAVASTVARSLGIIRWLYPAPELAIAWESATTEQERFAISTAFDLMNSYGGTIGEVLGVALFAAASVFLLCIAWIKDDSMPKWLSGFGLVAVLSLMATASGIFGMEPEFIVVFLGTTVIQFFFMALGLRLLFSRGN
jgi:hypothetical protein